MQRLLIAFVAILALAFNLRSAAVAWSDGHQILLGAEEANATEAAQPIISAKIARGGTLYGDWKQYPYDLAIYGPLTYIIPGLLGRALTWDGIAIWIAGRCISLAAGFAVLLLAARLWRKYGVRWWLGVLGLLILLPVLRIWNVALSFRPDLPAIALGLGGIILAGDWSKKSSWLALPCFLAALAYKPPAALVAPLAVALSLGWNRRPRQALIFSAAFSSLAIVYLLTLTLYTHRHFLDHAFLLGLNATYSPGLIRDVLGKAAYCAPVAVLPGLFRAAALPWRRPVDALALCALLSLLLAALISGRPGSNYNYFIEGIIYLILLTILSLEDFLRKITANLRAGAAQALAGVLMAACLFPYPPLIPIPPPPLKPRPLSFPAVATAFTKLSDELGTRSIFPGILSLSIIAGFPHPYSDGFLVDQLIQNGTLSEQDLVRSIRAAGYRYALLPKAPMSYQGIAFIPEAVVHNLQAVFPSVHYTNLKTAEGDLGFLLLSRSPEGWSDKLPPTGMKGPP